MPAGNQAFRESLASAKGLSGPLMKGLSEMTLSELDREASVAASAGNVHRANQYAWAFHLRFALGAATIVLASFIIAISGRRVALRGFEAFVLCFVYWALMFIGEFFSVYRTVLPTVAGAWLPNLVFASAILFVPSRLRGSRLRGSVVESPYRD